MSLKIRPKKEKNKIKKLIEESDSENDENIHELSFYINDRVKLMKTVLKIIKPKKIKSMAPDCIKDLDIEEINSMLLEELLGISNKRLKYIFNGQNLDEDSSSTDPEEEKQPIDIISLDDVSDDDFIIDVDSDKRKKRQGRIKEESSKTKKIKKEKHVKNKDNKEKHGALQEENLMSVLELLELQARARAIRSQLMLEANKKSSQSVEVNIEDDSDTDAVIIEVPKNEEIVITSSDSEIEPKEIVVGQDKHDVNQKTRSSETQKKKITLIRDRMTKQASESSTNGIDDKVEEVVNGAAAVDTNGRDKPGHTNANKNHVESNVSSSSVQEENNKCNLEDPDEDEVVIIMDHEEMDGIGD